MKTFLWEGTDQHNHLAHGKIQAPNIQLAREILKSKFIHSTTIYTDSLITRYKSNYRKISQKDMSIFFNQLSILISANIVLTTAIQFIEEGCQKLKLKALLHTIFTSLHKGNSFAYSLKQHPKYFSSLTCQLIHIAEQSGTLDIVLNHITHHDIKVRALKSKIKKALLYPAIVITVTLIILFIMLTYIIPQFSTLFENYNAALPLLTQIVIELSELFKNFGWIALIILCSFISTVFFAQYHYPLVKQRLDHYILHLPLIGTLIKKIILTRIANTLALMLGAGIPLLDALQLTSKISHNLTFLSILNHIQNHIRQGQMLHDAMRMHPIFPALCIQMVAIGEEAGKLDDMLQKVATLYESEVDRAMEYFERSLEPVLMTIISMIVGVLVVAMYLPIFKLGRVM